MSSGGAALSLDLGHFAPFALLTGAGFSCNWQGLPASKIWERVVSQPSLMANERLQGVLARADGDYEEALYLARASSDCTLEDVRQLEAGIVDVFRSQEDQISSLASEGGINRLLIQEFLSYFGPGPIVPNWHACYENGYLFTLNQDWRVERMWKPYPPFRHGLWTPGVPARTERYPTHWQDFDKADVRRIPDLELGQWSQDLRRGHNYIKLHGSFEWRTADGSNVLVMGGAKAEQIQRFPLLVTYFDIFRRICQAPKVRLMVIGYGFADPHVNEVLADAVRRRAAERWIFVIDTAIERILERLRKPGYSDGEAILTAILGRSTAPLTDTFKPPHSSFRTEEYQRILRDFFGIPPT